MRQLERLPSFVAPSLSPCLFTPCCNPQREHEHAPLNSARVCREGGGGKVYCLLYNRVDSQRRCRRPFCANPLAQKSSSLVAPSISLSRSGLHCIHIRIDILYISIHICFIYFLILLLIQFAFAFLLQLYEINDDPKRKEFLDDLFSFMQKRGKYSNRECAKKKGGGLRRWGEG